MKAHFSGQQREAHWWKGQQPGNEMYIGAAVVR